MRSSGSGDFGIFMIYIYFFGGEGGPEAPLSSTKYVQ